jgi:uncharacterized protein (TIRG00374 family)
MSDAPTTPVKKSINAWQIVFVIVGIGLLAAIMWRIDMNAVMAQVSTIGWGILLVIGIYLMAFLCDTVSWRLVIRRDQLHKFSFVNLFNIRMVGAAWNKVTPIFGMAGEPIKAVLMRRYHGVDYREGAASLVIAKTANLIALVIFLTSGLCLALLTDALPPAYRVGATIALLMLATGIGLLFVVQRFRLSSKSGAWLSRRWFGRPILRILDQMHALDERLAEAYTTDRRRFVMSVIMTLANWLIGVLELWVIMWLLDVPITLTEAWCIEAVVELVRAATFFIPAGIGTQEAALVLVIGHITGQAPLGLAVSFIRRARELVYVLWGFGINWFAYRSATKVNT